MTFHFKSSFYATRKLLVSPYIPAGAITPFFSTGTLPSGWVAFGDHAYYLRGTDMSSMSIGNTGGGLTGTVVVPSVGNHAGSSFAGKFGYAGSGSAASLNGYYAGGHGHTVPLSGNARPSDQVARLIKAASNRLVLPRYSRSFAGTESLSGMSEVSGTERFTYIDSSGGTVAADRAIVSTDSGVSSAVGNHTHLTKTASSSGSGTTRNTNDAGAHSHSSVVMTNITFDQYRTYVRAFEAALADVTPQNGMIFGWESAIIPDGYALCDGTKGTVDLSDRFIVIDDAQTPGTQAGTGVIRGTVSTNVAGSHNHYGSSVTKAAVTSYHSNNVSHSHAGAFSIAKTIPYYELAFIQAVDF